MCESRIDRSTRGPRRAWLVVVLMIAMAPMGCAWRMGGAEHYVGPVVFRHREPPDAEARVAEIVRFGVALEGGTQWGIAVGATHRLVAAPVDACDGPAKPAPIRARAVLAAAGEGWRFSPFYLRIDDAPQPVFVSRTTYGVELTGGPEARAISVGAAFRTQLEPPHDALSLFVFDASRPLATRFIACRDAPGRPLPLMLFERVER